MNETKYITAKNLKVGQTIHGYKINGYISIRTKVVQEITPFQVKLAWEDTPERSEWVNASALFEVELTNKEMYQKYHKDAEEIYKAIHTKLTLDEIGEHTNWNDWLAYDLYHLAQKCRKEKIKIIGYCEDIQPHHSWAGITLDIGICAESKDGTRFWCHASKDFFDYIERSKLIFEEDE